MKGKMMPMMLVMLVIILSGLYFTWQGISMHMQVDEEETSFHQLQEEYFSLNKAERDGAETNSDLNAKLVRLQQYPSELMELKLIGVGKILTGIFIVLLGILFALMMMPKRFAEVMKG